MLPHIWIQYPVQRSSRKNVYFRPVLTHTRTNTIVKVRLSSTRTWHIRMTKFYDISDPQAVDCLSQRAVKSLNVRKCVLIALISIRLEAFICCDSFKGSKRTTFANHNAIIIAVSSAERLDGSVTRNYETHNYCTAKSIIKSGLVGL